MGSYIVHLGGSEQRLAAALEKNMFSYAREGRLHCVNLLLTYVNVYIYIYVRMLMSGTVARCYQCYLRIVEMMLKVHCVLWICQILKTKGIA